MVRVGFTRAYGTSLHQIIRTGTKNRFIAFFSGIGVTALLQSSTATALLLTSFAKKSMIALPASLAVILGADVSTTLVAQVLSFDLSWLAPALISIGVIGHLKFDQGGRKRHISSIILGLGLMLLSLSMIRDISEPIKHSDILPILLGPLQNDTVLAILIAAFLTWLIHSSLASVLLFASLAGNGVIPLDLGILLILGANIGGAIVPFVTTYNDGVYARQITFANIIMRFATVLAALSLLDQIHILTLETSDDTARQLINLHTGFNLCVAIIFMPFIKAITHIMEQLFPEDPKQNTDIKALYLDNKALETPVIALAGAARETLRIAEFVENMLEQTITAFKTGNSAIIKDIKETDNKVDIIYDSIKLYMTQLSQNGLDPKEADRYIQILTFSTNLEHIGDIVDKSLMNLAEKKIRKQENFSEQGFDEIKHFHNQVLENFKLAQAIFMSEDPTLAAELVAEKKTIRNAAEKTSHQHFKRLSKGTPATLATSSLHLDIIRDYRRINSYATRVAFAILENHKTYKRKRNKHVDITENEL